MYTLGSGFIPSANHAGGLRFHGMSSTLSQLYHDGLMEARAVEQTSVFAAAEQFARVEGILPAPESSHAIRVAIDEALKCKETGEEKTILFGLTGTGYFDMVAYQKYNDGEMSDYIPTDADLQQGFDGLPKVETNASVSHPVRVRGNNRKGLNRVLDADDSEVNIALETMAGKGSEVGRTFEELRKIYDKVERKDRLRVCFDTCHVNDAGYDLVNDYEGVLAQFDRVLGLDQIAGDPCTNT